MGIEPTWRLFSRHNGFEARGGHQIRVHSPEKPHRPRNGFYFGKSTKQLNFSDPQQGTRSFGVTLPTICSVAGRIISVRVMQRHAD